MMLLVPIAVLWILGAVGLAAWHGIDLKAYRGDRMFRREARHAARMILAAPIWPLVVIPWGVFTLFKVAFGKDDE